MGFFLFISIFINDMNENIKLKDGRLLLIENDAGYVSPENNKEIINEMKNIDFSDDIILYAILQKYDTPNKNGRIYPEKILKREVEKYQSLIKKGGALNELNHPSCQKPDAQILTKDGWKELQHISDDEEVFTLTNTGDIELKRIYEKVIHSYKGKMIHLKGRNIDVSVTPNHKFPVINKNNKKQSFITAQEIFDSFNSNSRSLSNYFIPKNSNGYNQKNEYFTLKGLNENEFAFNCSEIDRIIYSQDLKIPMGVFMGFMGIYLSEGHVSLSDIRERRYVLSNGEEGIFESSNHGYSIGISQKIKEKIVLIDELLNLLPFNVKKYTKDDGTTSFVITDRRLHKFLKPLGKSHEKYIPEELKNQHTEHLETLLKWFQLGDGRCIGSYNQTDVFSTSQQLIIDLQEILIKSGKSGNIRYEKRDKDRYITDNGGPRLIKGENTHDMWFLTFSKTKGVWLDNRFLQVTEEDYDGFVFSVDVPNHTYYTKYNEKCHWTGNSNLLDLDRISHSILETWWDNEVLMGKIKLFTSPGWRKMGIVSTKGDQAAMLIMNGATLGISSRGVGSLKKEKNVNIVQSDFELVCFDLVSNPSTPGAYVFSDLKDKEKFNEETEKVNVNDSLNLMTKLNKFLSKR